MLHILESRSSNKCDCIPQWSFSSPSPSPWVSQWCHRQLALNTLSIRILIQLSITPLPPTHWRQQCPVSPVIIILSRYTGPKALKSIISGLYNPDPSALWQNGPVLNGRKQKVNVPNKLLQNEFFSLREKSKVFFSQTFWKTGNKPDHPVLAGRQLYLRCTI